MMRAGRLRIGFVLDDSLDKPDGVQQYVLTLGKWLRAQGHVVHYLTSTTRRDDVANIHTLSRNVAVRFNGNRMSMPLPASRRQLRMLLEREQFDVLHVQMPYSPLLAQKIINLAGPQTAVIGTFHILPHSRLVGVASRLLAIWCRRSLHRFDAVLSVSTAAQAFARQTFGVESDVIPNVVDIQRFAAAKPLSKPKNLLNIVFLGRLVPRKGCAVLLEALFEMRTTTNLPAFRVTICGRGPLEGTLRSYANTHHLDDIVDFAGFVSEADKPRYLRASDIAVFPSSGGESFGIVLVEAMAAGTAVLAGDNPGYRSVLAPRPDLLFPPHDAKRLADLLAEYLRDEAKRRDAQQWGGAYARQFDPAVVGDQISSIYTEMLRKRRGMR